MTYLKRLAAATALTAALWTPAMCRQQNQQKQNGEERETVEPIITEETLPNERDRKSVV